MLHDGRASDNSTTSNDLRYIRERGVAVPHRGRPVRCRKDLRILVVEDEAVIGILIEDILLDLGCGCVDLASSVETALGLLDDVSPDFAFLDINLNGTKSYPVADVLESRAIPFVFVSAYATHGLDTVHAARKILQKPFLPSDLDFALDSTFQTPRSVVWAA